MPTYVYETIPEKGKPKQFEMKQSMNDAPLTKHPKTGEPVRRVITGGYGFIQSASSRAADACSLPSSACCGGGCGLN